MNRFRFTLPSFYKYLILDVSFCLYILGITFPIFTSTKLFIFKESYTVITASFKLFNENQIFLAIVILLFTILLPIFKYTVLFLYLFLKNPPKIQLPKLIKTIGKWSMLDVFIVALFILSYKLSGGIISVDIQIGTIFFSLSVISCMLATYLVT